MQQSCGGNHRCSANFACSSRSHRQSWLCPKHLTDRTASHRVSDGRIPSHQIILFSRLSHPLGLRGLVPFSCFLFFCLTFFVFAVRMVGNVAGWSCGFLTFVSLCWVFLVLLILLNCCPLDRLFPHSTPLCTTCPPNNQRPRNKCQNIVRPVLTVPLDLSQVLLFATLIRESVPAFPTRIPSSPIPLAPPAYRRSLYIPPYR
ncbi:hypothetical protein BJX63DRAFT_374929 [Aspergillus granulosus]|uniref:Uncharacterized protein n=1 Tax=Aspergillus granulosus TaxID=176169 RepID=A0ABR4H0K6_9EURO